ncbi:TerC family protein [Aquihabitans sp. McL0605]|uniref:TerC family protein n=1 Tax=Aquihabitans sp. McL0605 TaxID=3415671 RepID=UPI003CEA537C
MFSLVLAEASSSSQHFASFDVHPWQWGLFIAFIAALIIADLLLVHRTAHEITFKEAAIESSIWIAIGLSFTGVVYWWHGSQASQEYISGYLIEKSLSIDNVFVWAVIFSYFAVPKMYQFRVLFWGIFGALVLRAIFIFAGVALIQAFEWVLVIFGVILLYSAWKIAFHDDQEVHPENNPVLKIVNRIIPSTTEYDGQKMFTHVTDEVESTDKATGKLITARNVRRVATPLLAVLIMVETTDVVFAVDSIPAILAVSHEQFIVFSSNAFAILGLRSLYFLLNGMQDKFRYLNIGLGLILAFVGLKMLASFFLGLHPPTWTSLVVICVLLAITMVASLAADRREGIDRSVLVAEAAAEADALAGVGPEFDDQGAHAGPADPGARSGTRPDAPDPVAADEPVDEPKG